MSREEYIIQDDTFLPCATSGPTHTSIIPILTRLQFGCVHVSLLLDAELLGNKDCTFLISVVLAQAKKQHKLGIKVMDFEVNQTRVQVPALPPATYAASTTLLP